VRHINQFISQIVIRLSILVFDRLKQEVAVLDMETAVSRHRDVNSLDVSTSSMPPHSPDRNDIQEVHDQLSETHRYTSSAREVEEARSSAGERVSRSDSPSSTPPRHKKDSDHSLFDILNMDPRTDFSNSPA
jgi:hypothetical protein